MRSIVCFLFIFSSLPILAQQSPSVKQGVMRWEKENKKIVIPYRISDGGSFKYEYEIKPFYTQDSGKTYIPIEKIKGHFGKDILSGENKEIWWFYEEENPDFDGQNLRFKLKADYKPSVFNLQNQEAMKYSVLLPGLGQNKVKYPGSWKNRWILTSVAVYGLIGGSIYVGSQANKTYDKYLISTTRSEAQSNFNEAKRQQRIAYGLAFLAGGIWATDIILVGIRGTKNKYNKKRILKRNEEMNTEIGIGIDNSTGLLNPSLGVKMKF
ncbi:MAG: hypothetical protein OHK0045_06670 [Raineya sp.]